MATPRSNLTALITVGGVLLLSGIVTTWLLRDFSSHHHAGEQTPSEAAFHDWLHSHLQLTADQEAALHPAEERYETQRRDLRSRIDTFGSDLAERLAHDAELTPPTIALLDQLAAAQTDLQRITLTHYFEMKQHLRPAQVEKLHQWTHDSLLHHHGH